MEGTEARKAGKGREVRERGKRGIVRYDSGIAPNFSRKLLVSASFWGPYSAFESMATLMYLYFYAETRAYFVSEDPLIIPNGSGPNISFLLPFIYCAIRQSYTSISTRRSPFRTSCPTNRHQPFSAADRTVCTCCHQSPGAGHS